MQCSTPGACVAVGDGDGTVFDVGSLWDRLKEVTDTRHRRGVRYPLDALLVLLALAKLAGADQLSAMADWVTNRQEALRTALGLGWARMPHHNTYRRILAQVVDPEELDGVVGAFLTRLPQTGTSVVVAFDGKTVRGTIDLAQPHGEHLLAA